MRGLFKFYAARLRHASPPELLYRFRMLVHTGYANGMVRMDKPPCRVSQLDRQLLSRLKLPRITSKVRAEQVRTILHGRLFDHGAGHNQLRRWQHELESKSGTVKPLNDAEPADIRTVWEPARLQHLSVLLYYLAQGDAGARREIELFVKTELLGWLKANPFLRNLHYRSAMECGLRIPVFVYSLIQLADLSESEANQISAAVYQHAWWIERNLSLYSSCGNHTVCEATGLVFAGVLFSKDPSGQKWLDAGVKLLHQELHRQILPDGGPLEQSFGYHRFVLDLYWLVISFLERNSIRDCQAMRERLQQGERFLTYVGGRGGSMPSVGDDDGGCAIAPGVTPERDKPLPADNGLTVFPVAGYSVLIGSEGLKLLFDHGPLGMAPLYNHGHADALSISVTINDEPLLVDPGTFRYNGAPQQRAYFKGTSAHNTVVVDGQDQAEQVTGFIWYSPFESRVLQNEQRDGVFHIEAEHNGYLRLAGPVLHKRLVSYSPHESIMIRDSFDGSGEHEYTIHFHIHPEAEIRSDGRWWMIRRENSAIWLRLLGDHHFELLEGRQTPFLGWYSAGYGRISPAAVLRCHRQGACSSVIFRTCIRLRKPA